MFAFVVGDLSPHASNKNARAIQHKQVYDARLSMNKANNIGGFNKISQLFLT